MDVKCSASRTDAILCDCFYFEPGLMMVFLRRIFHLQLTRVSLVAGFVVALGLAVGWSRPKNVADDIMPMLGLKSGELITIATDQAGKSEMAIKMNGKDYTIDYTFQSNRSKTFRLMVQQQNGELVEQDAPSVNTIRGTLRGVEGSRVIGCITEDGCCAKIKFPSGENCYLQPINRTIDDVDFAGVHVVYSKDDLVASEGRCGCVANLAEAEAAQHLAEASAAVSAEVLQECEVAVNADFEYFSIFGSTNATLAEIELIINILNDQYESEAGIRHTVSTAVIFTTADDPYTDTTVPIDLLNEVRDYFQDEELGGDVGHLFTGRDLDGSTIGISFSSGGGICRFQTGFGLSESVTPLSFMTDLVAHELGHNWNLRHCDCPDHTMNARITGANDFNDTLTVPGLISYRDTRTCLDSITSPVNDDLAGETLIANPNFSVTGSNINATTEAEEQNLLNVGSSVWWQLNAEENGTITIDTFGSDFDTQLYVYESVPDGGLAGLVLVGDNDDMGGMQSEVTFDVTAGTCYKFRVGGSRSSLSISDGSEGNIVLSGSFNGGVLLGDVNLDGVVNFLDIPSFISVLTIGGFQAEADLDQSGSTNFLDISPFIALLTGT